MPIRVVTDSNCDLPPDLVDRHRIVVVPSLLNIGQRSLRDEIDPTRSEYYRQLPGFNPLPTTAAPSAGAFENAFRECGSDPIICLTLAARPSGIYNAARHEAEVFAARSR